MSRFGDTDGIRLWTQTLGELGDSPCDSVVLLHNWPGIWYALFLIQLMKY